jgi:hypothetical protein
VAAVVGVFVVVVAGGLVRYTTSVGGALLSYLCPNQVETSNYKCT